MKRTVRNDVPAPPQDAHFSTTYFNLYDERDDEAVQLQLPAAPRNYIYKVYAPLETWIKDHVKQELIAVLANTSWATRVYFTAGSDHVGDVSAKSLRRPVTDDENRDDICKKLQKIDKALALFTADERKEQGGASIILQKYLSFLRSEKLRVAIAEYDGVALLDRDLSAMGFVSYWDLAYDEQPKRVNKLYIMSNYYLCNLHKMRSRIAQYRPYFAERLAAARNGRAYYQIALYENAALVLSEIADYKDAASVHQLCYEYKLAMLRLSSTNALPRQIFKEYIDAAHGALHFNTIKVLRCWNHVYREQLDHAFGTRRRFRKLPDEVQIATAVLTMKSFVGAFYLEVAALTLVGPYAPLQALEGNN